MWFMTCIFCYVKGWKTIILNICIFNQNSNCNWYSQHNLSGNCNWTSVFSRQCYKTYYLSFHLFISLFINSFSQNLCIKLFWFFAYVNLKELTEFFCKIHFCSWLTWEEPKIRFFRMICHFDFLDIVSNESFQNSWSSIANQVGRETLIFQLYPKILLTYQIAGFWSSSISKSMKFEFQCLKK